MLSQFDNRTCTHCESKNLAVVIHYWGYPIPKGIEGFIGCRDCSYWEKLLSISQATHIFDKVNFKVLTAGKGEYGQPGLTPLIIYDDPNKDTYERFDWSKAI